MDGSLSVKELESLLLEKTEALEECVEMLEKAQCDTEQLRKENEAMAFDLDDAQRLLDEY